MSALLDARDDGTAPPLRILLAGTSYPSSPDDWKGLFIQRLVEALARRRDIALRLWLPPGDIPQGTDYAATAGDAAWLQRLMDAGGIAHVLRNDKLAGLTRCPECGKQFTLEELLASQPDRAPAELETP